MNYRRKRGYGRRSRGKRGRTDLRLAALIIVAFVAGMILFRAGVITPFGGLLR